MGASFERSYWLAEVGAEDYIGRRYAGLHVVKKKNRKKNLIARIKVMNK
jgi:hypothetical protein